MQLLRLEHSSIIPGVVGLSPTTDVTEKMGVMSKGTHKELAKP